MELGSRRDKQLDNSHVSILPVMPMTLDTIIDEIMRKEGGSAFTNHAKDKGGATRWGVTQATLADWRKRPVTIEDVRALTEAEARDIYRHVYAIRPGLVKLTSEAVLELAVDCAVNHGVSQAVKMLQEAARVFPDGHFGPKSESAANRMNPRVLYQRLCAQRARLYGRIITRDESQAVFAAGWLNRLANFIENSP